jgi:hypothetical protein
VGLSRQINDPNLDSDEKDRAILRRERLIVERGEIIVELHELRCPQEGIERSSRRV